MKKLILPIIFTIALLSCRNGENGRELIRFADKNLERAVRRAINKPQFRLSSSDLSEITELGFSHKITGGVTSLEGLEHLTSLTRLNLDYRESETRDPLVRFRERFFPRKIKDLSPLKDLIHLRELYLAGNEIEELSPLKDLIFLDTLHLELNKIEDISPLKELEIMFYLRLDENRIADLSPLAELKELTRLSLMGNRISDLRPLQDLDNLDNLYLSRNRIEDLEPLKELINLSRLTLDDNQISEITPLMCIEYLNDLSLRQNRIADITSFIEKPNIFLVDLRDNPGIPKSQLEALQEKGVRVRY